MCVHRDEVRIKIIGTEIGLIKDLYEMALTFGES